MSVAKPLPPRRRRIVSMSMTFSDIMTWVIYLAFLGCFVVLMGHFLFHKQWAMVGLSLFFAAGCLGSGFLIALVVGWQEAANWKIQKLMRWYTGLLVVSFMLAAHTAYLTMTAPPPAVDPQEQARQRAAKNS